MTEVLADDLQTTLAVSREEARNLRHSFIGTPHLLLGLTRLESPAEPILRSFGLARGEVWNAVRSIMGQGEALIVSGNIELTPLAQTTLDLAIAEAGQLGYPQATSKHLLLGLARIRQGFVVGVLEWMKVNPSQLQQAIEFTLSAEERS